MRRTLGLFVKGEAFEDCFGDGWLLRIEAADPEELDSLSQASSSEDE